MSRERARLVEKIARADLRETPRRAASRDARSLAIDLARAIERAELRLHFQPIVNLRTAECRRVEALLRWRTRYGTVPAADLIGAARASGQLGVLGRWVVDAAARQLASWRQEGLTLAISINLSGPELESPGFRDEAIASLRRVGVDPSAVSYEIPAGAFAAASPTMRNGLRELALAGSRIAMDDVTFADTPGRSLARELDELKLGRALVGRVASDAGAAREARALVELARDFGLVVVAVGIEDRATRDLLAAMGCDLAQGHGLSRPLAGSRVRPWQRMAAGFAFTSAVAATALLPAPRASASTGSGPARAAAEMRGLLPGICTCDVPGLPADNAAPLEVLRKRTGRDFVAHAVARADIYIEASVRGVDRTRIVAAVERDTAAIAASYRRPFASRPAIYVFGSRTSFAHGLQQVFGMRSLDAGVLASANGGVTLPRQGAVVINIDNLPNDEQLGIVRHELTHVLLHEIVGPETVLPAWLDEGLATLEERKLRANDDGTREAATTLALLLEGKVSLTDLGSAREWISKNAALSGGAYGVAADGARLLQARVTPSGLLHMLELTGQGTAFDQAYAEVAGESLSDFERNFASRLLSEQDTARITQREVDEGVVWTLAGFAADAKIDIVIAGPGYRLAYSVTTDRLGMFSGVFGPTAPSGDYVLEASGRDRTATAVLRVGRSATAG